MQTQREEYTLKALQCPALEAPIDEVKAAPSSLNQGESNHAEVATEVKASVVLPADVSIAREERFGQRGQHRGPPIRGSAALKTGAGCGDDL
jgi:hypothetical protein